MRVRSSTSPFVRVQIDKSKAVRPISFVRVQSPFVRVQIDKTKPVRSISFVRVPGESSPAAAWVHCGFESSQFAFITTRKPPLGAFYGCESSQFAFSNSHISKPELSTLTSDIRSAASTLT